MSRFLDASARRIELGACDCPGLPHAGGDWVDVASVVAWSDLIDIAGEPTDGARRLALVVRAVNDWNLSGPDGEVVPIDTASIRVLSPATLELIAGAVNDAYETATAPVPNASGAPSRHSRRASASQTRRTRPTAKPTRSS